MSALQNSIYLLQTREFINTSVYKLGKTTKPLLIRFNQYPNGSRLLLQMACLDCDYCEKKLLEIFRTKYKNRTEYGREYFEGDSNSMTRDIFDFIMDKYNINTGKEVEIIKPTETVIIVDVVKENKTSKLVKNTKNLENTKEEKEYSCERCLCVFKSKTTLIKHLKNKTGCICIESKRSRQYILDDLMYKEGIKCNSCNCVYSTIYTLKRHQDSQNCRNINELEYLKQEIKQIHKILKKTNKNN
jgi:hypothetical protein